MYRSRHILLLALFEVLAARGLHSGALDPWRGWVAFKHFTRSVAEQRDPGVSVQVSTDAAGCPHLVFLRQVFDPRESELQPIGGVVCEFTFAAEAALQPALDRWTFDHSSFERFVDAVEQDPRIADLLLRVPSTSSVYWEEA